MTHSEILKLIRTEIAIAMQTIASGQAGDNTITAEDIQNLFPGMPTLAARPIMHPYGFVSRAQQ